jgi:hypothetical protein
MPPGPEQKSGRADFFGLYFPCDDFATHLALFSEPRGGSGKLVHFLPQTKRSEYA